MKLPKPSAPSRVGASSPPLKTVPAGDPEVVALLAAANGYRVFPWVLTKNGDKMPWERGWQDKATTDPDAIRAWVGGGYSGFGILTGAGLLAVDLDVKHPPADGVASFEGLGLELPSYAARTLTGGRHVFYRVDATVPNRVNLLPGVDLRGDGGYVVLYDQAPLPLGQLPALPPEIGRYLASPSADPDKPPPRSMLSMLLSKPPAEGERNSWIAKVAGHYAKTYRRQPDLYRVQCRVANQLMPRPLGPAELDKTLDSIWDAEQTNHPEREVTADTGWLLSAGDHILTQVKQGKSDLILAPWSDFDLTVRGVLTDSDGVSGKQYDCALTRQRDGRVIDVLIPGAMCAEGRKLSAYLNSYGVSYARPDSTFPNNPADPTRLLRYLEAQGGPSRAMAPALGWDTAGRAFLTFDGAITPAGPQEFSTIRPDPTLATRGVAAYHYGFTTPEQATGVLREVLTFHDHRSMAVFGAWWAACLLKPQIQQITSVFPVMAIEAASGAGKTNGAFALLSQLAGSLQGPGATTKAAFRDRVAATNNGIVWVDDMDTIENLEELTRLAAMSETTTKKDTDNSSNVAVRLRAPIVLSGEQLGLNGQKALLDRVVTLNPPRPDSRMSLHDPTRPQWDDITELVQQHDTREGLAVHAGTLVQLALGFEEQTLATLRAARTELKDSGNRGRQADKLAVVVAGAKLLGLLTGDPQWETTIAEWVESTDAAGLSAGDWDNRLTVEILPWALRDSRWPSSPVRRPPVWVQDADGLQPVVWVNCSTLADAWRDHLRGRVVERTDNQRAIVDQVIRCQVPGEESKRYFNTNRPGDGQARQQSVYWRLGGEVAGVVLERSRH